MAFLKLQFFFFFGSKHKYSMEYEISSRRETGKLVFGESLILSESNTTLVAIVYPCSKQIFKA